MWKCKERTDSASSPCSGGPITRSCATTVSGEAQLEGRRLLTEVFRLLLELEMPLGACTPTSQHVFLLSAGSAQSFWRSTMFADWLSKNRARLSENIALHVS